jgi:hypothetical protein
MSFEKNTVDFLKEYVLRYKKILYWFFAIIAFLIVKNIYNKFSFWSFNNHLNDTEKTIKSRKISAPLNKFFKGNFSYIISHRTIFVMAYTYSNGIKLLMEQFKNDKQIMGLIDKGQWTLIMNLLKEKSMDNKETILDLLKNLEKIYGFVLKRKPYICVLNSKHVHSHGELLNLLVFVHITEREKPDTIIEFFHRACLHISLYKTYTKFLFYKSTNPQLSMHMDIYNDNTNGNLLKKFINF